MDQNWQKTHPQALYTKGLFAVIDLKSKNKNINILNYRVLTGKVCPMQMGKGENSKGYTKKLRP